MTIKVASVAANGSIALYWLQKEENEHNQEVEIGLARDRLGDNWRLSSPVLAAYYDAPAFTGGGSSGYNASNATDN